MAEYWYCLEHRTVEAAEGCRATSRLGPYPTVSEAERAIDTAAERTEEWENDPAWNDPDENEDDAG